MTTKKITKRQIYKKIVLWGFNFVIFYTTGKENENTDSLTWYSNDFLIDNNNDYQ